MLSKLRYDLPMRSLGLVSVLSIVLVFTFCATPQAKAQGVPASVTSTGFGGHFDRAPGIPASVTSSGTLTVPVRHPIVVPQSCCTAGFVPGTLNRGRNDHRHHSDHPDHHINQGFANQGFGGGGVVYYPMPYAVSSGDEEQMLEEQQTVQDQQVDYRGGPTIFDRGGPVSARPQGDNYAPGVQGRVQAPVDPPDPPPSVPAAQPVKDLPQTVLVFKDGHQAEVSNYAIVGATLFDLTPGHQRKVPLSDLDLQTTSKQNEDRGVDFRLPLGTS